MVAKPSRKLSRIVHRPHAWVCRFRHSDADTDTLVVHCDTGAAGVFAHVSGAAALQLEWFRGIRGVEHGCEFEPQLVAHQPKTYVKLACISHRDEVIVTESAETLGELHRVQLASQPS